METLKSKLNIIWILAAVSVGGILLFNAPIGPKPIPKNDNSEACQNHPIQGIKEGIIVRNEEDWTRVYVSEQWDQVMMDEKQEIGYFLALCRSATEAVEIVRASDETVLAQYKIDLHYRMQHGLPINK